MNKKLFIIIVVILSIALLISLYFNFRKSKPIIVGTSATNLGHSTTSLATTSVTNTGTGVNVNTTSNIINTDTGTGTISNIKINQLIYNNLSPDQKKAVDGYLATFNNLMNQYNLLPPALKSNYVGQSLQLLINNILLQLKNYGVIV